MKESPHPPHAERALPRGRQAWTWRGFVQLQRFLSDTGAVAEPALAAQLTRESTTFKSDLDNALRATQVSDPETGSVLFVPPYAALNFTPYDPAHPSSIHHRATR